MLCFKANHNLISIKKFVTWTFCSSFNCTLLKGVDASCRGFAWGIFCGNVIFVRLTHLQRRFLVSWYSCICWGLQRICLSRGPTCKFSDLPLCCWKGFQEAALLSNCSLQMTVSQRRITPAEVSMLYKVTRVLEEGVSQKDRRKELAKK